MSEHLFDKVFSVNLTEWARRQASTPDRLSLVSQWHASRTGGARERSIRADRAGLSLASPPMVSVSTPESRPTTNGPISTGRSPACASGGQDRAAGRPSGVRGRLGHERRSGKGRRLLADPKVTTVVVEHRDRLGRMNIELVEAALESAGRRLVVLDEVRSTTTSSGHDEVLTSFCARLYGRRSARNRAEKALRKAAEVPAS